MSSTQSARAAPSPVDSAGDPGRGPQRATGIVELNSITLTADGLLSRTVPAIPGEPVERSPAQNATAIRDVMAISGQAQLATDGQVAVAADNHKISVVVRAVRRCLRASLRNAASCARLGR